jgi:hypothetical protein
MLSEHKRFLITIEVKITIYIQHLTAGDFKLEIFFSFLTFSHFKFDEKKTN